MVPVIPMIPAPDPCYPCCQSLQESVLLPNPQFPPPKKNSLDAQRHSHFPGSPPSPRIQRRTVATALGRGTLGAEGSLLGWNPWKSGAWGRLDERVGGVGGDAAGVGGVPGHPDVSRVSELHAPALGTGKTHGESSALVPAGIRGSTENPSEIRNSRCPEATPGTCPQPSAKSARVWAAPSRKWWNYGAGWVGMDLMDHHSSPCMGQEQLGKALRDKGGVWGLSRAGNCTLILGGPFQAGIFQDSPRIPGLYLFFTSQYSLFSREPYPTTSTPWFTSCEHCGSSNTPAERENLEFHPIPASPREFTPGC